LPSTLFLALPARALETLEAIAAIGFLLFDRGEIAGGSFHPETPLSEGVSILAGGDEKPLRARLDFSIEVRLRNNPRGFPF